MDKKIYNIILILIILVIISLIIYEFFCNFNTVYILKETPVYYNTDKNFKRGVFAARNIKLGEKIEVSPTIHIEKVDGILKNYVFEKSGKHYVAFGCGSMFNHSDKPNVDWSFNDRNDILFVANKPIRKNDQLMINYGTYYWTSRSDKKIT
jgi:SET domain-containing protein